MLQKRIYRRGRRRINKKEEIRRNVEEVTRRVAKAAGASGRSPGEITIVAAVKNRSIVDIKEAIDCGIKDIGENRVQEVMPLRDEVGDQINWHFIGHLQRNKVKYILDFVKLIHSLDSLRLALAINKRASMIGKIQDVLLQVNVAEEPTKFGFMVSDVQVFLRELGKVEHLRIRGLSTIAPLVEDSEEARWVFSELRELGRRLESEYGNFECSLLSMGMTNDFEVAVEEGANLVRIGTAIFEG